MDPFLPAPARLAAGRRVYAIGDVHGCAERLAALHARIAEDMRARPVREATIVHLGDLIDRGPDSAGVVAMLVGRREIAGCSVVNLQGNHEAMMLAALGGGSDGGVETWMENGGEASLASWGIKPGTRRARWALSVPLHHLAFLGKLEPCWEIGPYFFAHAGVRPGVPLEEQMEADLLWIREPFLSSEASFGAVVVHGHTPVPEPVLRLNRIGIDTGAVLGGKLTCAVLEDDRVAFWAA